MKEVLDELKAENLYSYSENAAEGKKKKKTKKSKKVVVEEEPEDEEEALAEEP